MIELIQPKIIQFLKEKYNLFYIPLTERFNTNIQTPVFLLQNNLCEFLIRICTQKPVLNFRFKGFWYTKINLSQK